MNNETKFDVNDFKLNQKMTPQEAQDFLDGKLKLKYFFKAWNQINENCLDGGIYAYTRDLKPFKSAPVRVHFDWGIDEKRYIEDFEGKKIWLGHDVKKPKVSVFDEAGEMGAITFYVDQVFNELGWQNEKTLEALENEYLQPDDNFC